MNQEIHIYRENGVIYMIGNGDQYCWDMATGLFKQGKMQPLPQKKPSFWHKLRRFVRRLRLTIKHYAEEAQYNRHHPAALMPYIGMEDRSEL